MLAIRPPQPTKTGAGIQKSKSKSKKFTPNLLPCRVNYTARIPVAKRYWDPRAVPVGKEKEELTSYFRGRKFTGRKVAVPEGYRGFVGRVGEEVLPVAEEEVGDEEEDEEEKQVETKVMEELGVFDEIVVWGHEGVGDVGGEGVVRGVEEWIEWAGKVC
ncbi:ribonuclease H2 subunit C protein [Rutstroemia sp. NJR-2017a BBW]|nr:ribonuclease H2 subunit C protein [Rutstroemia sp. NJR-2017a BBW]